MYDRGIQTHFDLIRKCQALIFGYTEATQSERYDIMLKTILPLEYGRVDNWKRGPPARTVLADFCYCLGVANRDSQWLRHIAQVGGGAKAKASGRRRSEVNAGRRAGGGHPL